ncbi:MAG: class I SAM-dependent methyltransferase [Burkholderiales bacterium]|nr:class I SAM-dependent methyltransferase [Burkholderiales bacterium]
MRQAAPYAVSDEPSAIAERYARRRGAGLYDPLRPEVWLALQERERALIALLRQHVHRPLAELDVLEVGCGAGDTLLQLLRLGFDPARLAGAELLPERAAAARRRLPAETAVHLGDALLRPQADASLDLVVLSTVFSSILDEAFRQRLAARIWGWLRPGGAVLWYDFAFDNPRNPDVRGVRPAQLRALFPAAVIDARRVTLAPPIARRVVRLHPRAWTVCNALPLLRSHCLAWVGKAHEADAPGPATPR